MKERVREYTRSFPIKKSMDPQNHSGKCYLDSNLNIVVMQMLRVKVKQENIPDSDSEGKLL